MRAERSEEYFDYERMLETGSIDQKGYVPPSATATEPESAGGLLNEENVSQAYVRWITCAGKSRQIGEART